METLPNDLETYETAYLRSPEGPLADIAGEIDRSPHALSTRLRRGQKNLVEHTLIVTPPSKQ